MRLQATILPSIFVFFFFCCAINDNRLDDCFGHSFQTDKRDQALKKYFTSVIITFVFFVFVFFNASQLPIKRTCRNLGKKTDFALRSNEIKNTFSCLKR